MTKRLSPEEKRRRSLHRLMHPKRRKLKSAFYTKKCADLTCGKCVRCSRSRAWANGAYDDKRKSIPKNAWPPEQEQRLRDLSRAGSPSTIAEVLTREFPELPARTARAVSQFAYLHDIFLWPPGHSLTEIASLLGVTPGRVQTWVRRGLLVAFPYEKSNGKHHSTHRVTSEAVADFIRAHPEQYSAQRVTGVGYLADLARLCARRYAPVRLTTQGLKETA